MTGVSWRIPPKCVNECLFCLRRALVRRLIGTTPVCAVGVQQYGLIPVLHQFAHAHVL